MLPESATVEDTDRSPRRAVATVVAVVFVDLLGSGIVVPILPFYVRSFGVSDVFIGLLAASYSLAQFGVAPWLGRVSDERGRRPVLMLSMAGSAVAWTLFGLGVQFRALFAADPVVGAAALVSGAATEETQGSAFGVTQGAGSLGRTVGPPVMTGLYVLATAAPFLLGAVLTVGVVALLVSVARGVGSVVPAD